MQKVWNYETNPSTSYCRQSYLTICKNMQEHVKTTHQTSIFERLHIISTLNYIIIEHQSKDPVNCREESNNNANEASSWKFNHYQAMFQKQRGYKIIFFSQECGNFCSPRVKTSFIFVLSSLFGGFAKRG